MNTTLLVYPIERSCSSSKRKTAAPKRIFTLLCFGIGPLSPALILGPDWSEISHFRVYLLSLPSLYERIPRSNRSDRDFNCKWGDCATDCRSGAPACQAGSDICGCVCESGAAAPYFGTPVAIEDGVSRDGRRANDVRAARNLTRFPNGITKKEQL